MTYEESYKYLTEGRKVLVTLDGGEDRFGQVVERLMFSPSFVMLNETTPFIIDADYGYCVVEIEDDKVVDKEFEDIIPLFTFEEVNQLEEVLNCIYLKEYELYVIKETPEREEV